MNAKSIVIVAVCVAVCAGSYALVVRYKESASIARSEAAKAASEEETQLAKTREEKERAAAERAKESAAKEKAKAEADKKESTKLAAAQAKAEAETQKLKTEEARLANDTANKNAQAMADERAAKEAILKAKKAEQAIEEAKEKTAVAEEEKEKAAERKAEAETYKLKHSYAEVNRLYEQNINKARELEAYRRDLDAREAALHPEKTVNDLVSLGEDEETKCEETPYLAENDKSLTVGSRALARAARLETEADSAHESALRAEIVSRMESLYETALKEDRVIDADYYATVLRSFYPDWEYGAKKTEGNEE